nr:unnamed protein product [Spirometra erinaceieuropaei]
MPDLAGLDDVVECTSSRVTIGDSGSRQLSPLSSPAAETEYRRSKNRLHASTNYVESDFELTSTLWPLSDVLSCDSFNFTAAINAANHPTARWTVNPTFTIDTTASVVTDSRICHSTVWVSAIGNFN